MLTTSEFGAHNHCDFQFTLQIFLSIIVGVVYSISLPSPIVFYRHLDFKLDSLEKGKEKKENNLNKTVVIVWHKFKFSFYLSLFLQIIESNCDI